MKRANFILISFLLNLSGMTWCDELQAEKEAIEKAHETLTVVRKNFKNTLKQAIAEKGIAGAVPDCQVKAPSLGQGSEQVEIGRTSLKLRNPTNEPRPWVRPLLEEYQKTAFQKQAKHRLIQLGPNHFGYVEPIYVEAVCLNCHGANLKPEVKKEILQLYPKDQATGFKVGDFRGLIWLESRAK